MSSEVAKKKILVVDDEIEICKIVKEGLERLGGFDVSMATSGEDGITKALEIRPDLVILDLLMPDMHGLEVSRRIKKYHDIAATPIIMLSGVKDEAAIEESKKLRNELYLTKPIMLTELKEKIDEVLRGRGVV
ncbi:MAG: response regulator [Candidatus Omnitrophota bacterium]